MHGAVAEDEGALLYSVDFDFDPLTLALSRKGRGN